MTTEFVEDDPLFPLMAQALSDAYSAGDPVPQDPQEEWGRGAALCVRVARDAMADLAALAGKHDPTGADHMEEMMAHALRADEAEQSLAQLRSVSAMQDDEIRVLKMAIADWAQRLDECRGAQREKDMPTRFGNCSCQCHIWPGVKHLRACCGPMFFTQNVGLGEVES